MVCVTAEISEGVFTRRVRITAPSIERALKIAGQGKPGRLSLSFNRGRSCESIEARLTALR